MSQRKFLKKLMVFVLSVAMVFTSVNFPAFSLTAQAAEGESPSTSVSGNETVSGNEPGTVTNLITGLTTYVDTANAAATIDGTTTDGTYVINITDKGTENYHVQLVSQPDLVVGTIYNLSFDIQAQRNAKLGINIQDRNYYSSIMKQTSFDIPGGETVHVSINTNAATFDNGNVAFLFGNEDANVGNTITLSNVSLTAGAKTESIPASTPESETGSGDEPETATNLITGLTDNTCEGGAATFDSAVAGTYGVTVTNKGIQNYAVQLYQAVSLTQGTVYNLSFDITAQSAAVVKAEIQEDGGSWASIMKTSPTVFQIPAGTSHVSINTNAAGAVHANGKLALMFGNEDVNVNNTITISNVSLTAGEKTESIPGQTPTPKPDPTPVDRKRVVISEQKAQAFTGEPVTLTYVASKDEFEFGDDYTLTIDGANVDASKVTITDDTITLDGSLFATAKVYTILFGKTGYEVSPVYQRVYPQSDKTGDEKWELIWNDEFDGTELDSTKWDYQTGTGAAYGVAGWGNQEEEYYTDSPENSKVADGTLTITAKKDSTHSGTNYTSARIRTVTEDINTNGNANLGTALQIGTYGRVEAKMKMPAGKGIWPAFWMLPYDSEYGTWATSGELDIMEARGRLPQEVGGTIHYGGIWPNNVYKGKTYQFAGDDSIEEYHIYAVEWDPTEITWLVDGVEYGSLTNWYAEAGEEGNWPFPAPFDEEFYVLLNLAVGGTYDSAVASSEIEVDENGVDMDVDYVRWYQRDASVYEDWVIGQPTTEKDGSADAEALLALADDNGNFIVNGDFSNTDIPVYKGSQTWTIQRGNWFGLTENNNGNGKAAWEYVQNAGKTYAKINVSNAGSQTYSSQMIQYFPLVKGYDYEISYVAYTDTANPKADISLKMGGDDDNGWGVYSGNYTDELTTTPTKYTHKFSMTSDTDPTARFEFNLATSTGNVYISDVCVKITTIDESEGEDDAKAPLSDGNHVYNGEFMIGSDSLLYWHWSNDDSASVVSAGKEDGKRVAKVTVGESAVSMWQYGMNLLQSDSYKLTFKVNGTQEQNVNVKFTDKAGTEVYAEATKTVSAGDQEVEVTFTQPEDKTDVEAKMIITFEKSASIDKVKLVRTTNNNLDLTSINLWPIYNGDFFNGKDGWNIWHEAAGYQTSEVNAAGQLSSNVTVGQGGTFYCVGIQSKEMNLTKGIKYRVKFDYTLPSDKNYTLELAGVQREITLQSGTHTYVSEPFTGNGNCTFTLYLGPDQTETYNLLLDNVEVYVDPDFLPLPAGYAKPVSMKQSGRGEVNTDLNVVYTEDASWEAAAKTYYINGEAIDSDDVTINAETNTITIAGSCFTEGGEYTFAAKAEGYTITQNIKLTVFGSSNLLLNGDFSQGISGWTFYLADWTSGGSFSVNDDGVGVIEHQYCGGENWHFQLYQDGIEYKAGKYVVSFDAWVDTIEKRPIAVQLQKGNEAAFAGTYQTPMLTQEKQTFKYIFDLTAQTEAKFNMLLGTVTADGVTAPNDGSNPYKIYLDNIELRPVTDDDYNDVVATIASPGAGKTGEDVVITYSDVYKAWKEAPKSVYVNGKKISSNSFEVAEDGMSMTIKGSVFKNAGAYEIYIVAKNFAATNKVNKNIIGTDGNLIFDGDLSSQGGWEARDENADDLSAGKFVNGQYVLDYTAGYYRADWYCWVTWSSQLYRSNISVEKDKEYVLRFKANTDLTGGRDIIVEISSATPNQTTVHVDEETGIYEVKFTAQATTDELKTSFLLGPVGSNLQIDTNNTPGANVVPHTLMIDSIEMYEAAAAPEMPGQAKAEGLWIKNIDDQTYTGKEIKPVIEVYEGTELLTSKDYSVSFKNNKNVGTATVTVTGRGNYSGKDTTTFQIKAKDIADVDVTAADVYAVLKKDGKSITNPKVTVKFNGKTLKAAAKKAANDYTITYPEFDYEEDGTVIPGDYSITLTGNGNFKGTKEITYSVYGYKTSVLKMKDANIKFAEESIKEIDYFDTETLPEFTVTLKGNTLVKGTDFEIEWPDTFKVGKNTVTFVALTSSELPISGSKDFKVNVVGAGAITKGDITGINADGYSYTGSAIEPELTVIKHEEELTLGRDYTLTYKKNVNAGTASVDIKGIGGYSGKVTLKYKINKVNLTDEMFTVATEGIYSSKGAKPDSIEGRLGTYELVEGRDFTVKYSGNKDISEGDAKATATIKGKGNFTGTLTKDYQVVASGKDAVEATVKEMYNPKKASKVKIALKEKASGAKLKEGTDYTVEYLVADGYDNHRPLLDDDLKDIVGLKVKARVTFKEKYGNDTQDYTIRIYTKKASDFVVAINNKVYDAKDGLPDITVKVKDVKVGKNWTYKTLTRGEDYEILNVTNGFFAGTAKVTIEGLGEYGGTKTATYKIAKKPMSFAGVN